MECGAERACSRFAGVRFISAFQSHVSFILGFAWHQEQASCPEELLFLATRTGKLPGGATFLSYKNRQAARRVVSTAPPACGWLRGTSRTSPGPPRRWRRPVRLQGTSARGRGFAAYLPGCARQLLSVRCAHYVRRRHYRSSLLAAASNALTFVRGADRACCAPRKRRHNLTYVPSKWPLGLLYCINGFADQPIPASASRRATPKGVERAPGSGTLPPDAADPEGCRARTRQAPCRLLNILCSMRNVTRPGPFPRS